MSLVRLSFSFLLLPHFFLIQEPVSQEKPKVREVPVLEGIVLDAEDRPVGGALIVTAPVSPGLGDRPMTGHSGPDGRFRIDLVSEKPLRVRIEADGFAPWIDKDVSPGKILEIIMERGSFIEGIIHDGDTMEPVSAARIEVASQDRVFVPGSSQPRLGILEAETDEKGNFRVDGIGAAAHTVSASAKGYGRARKTSVQPGESVELFLFSGSSISGTVSSPDREPVEGAWVQLEERQSNYFRPLGSARHTDATGRFDVFGVEPGKHRLVIKHKDFAPVIVAGVEVKADEDLAIDVPLSFGTQVEGRLIDPEEHPVRGRVSVEYLDGAAPARLLSDLRAEASDNGEFTLGKLPPGSHTLLVEAPGFAQQSIDVAIGDGREPIDLGDVLLEVGLAIRGRIVDATGQSVANAFIGGFNRGRIMDEGGRPKIHRTTSEGDGSFTLAGLNEGPYEITVRAKGFALQTKGPIEAGEFATFVLETAGSISGFVKDEERRPVESYWVSATPKERRTRGGGQKEVFGPEGSFLLEDIGEGDYVLEVRAAGFQTATVSEVQVSSGQDTNVGVVLLKRGGIVSGLVVDPFGAPVAGASIRITSPGRFTRRTAAAATTDGDGFFEIQGLPEGDLGLVASHPSYAEGRVDGLSVDSKSGPTETQIMLSFGGAVEGWVRGRDGNGIPGRIVAFSPKRTEEPYRVYDPRNQSSTETSAEGRYRIERLPAGPGKVQVTAPSGIMAMRAQAKEVEIIDGETTYVDFDARQVLVHGQVTDSGAPAPGLELMLYPSSGSGGGFAVSVSGGLNRPATAGPQINRAVTREDGTYELIVDQPGEYIVSISRLDGSHPPRQRVNIPDTDNFALDLDFGGTTILGVVLEKRTEEPVAGASVSARSAEPEPGTGSTSAQTKQDGSFQMELEPGEYLLFASAEGYGRDTKKLNVGSSTPPDVVFSLPVGLSIQGTVVDGFGQGTSDLFVLGTTGEEKNASIGVGRTLADGTFLMEDLVAKPHNLLVATRRGTFAFQTGIQPGAEDVVLTLEPGGRATVRAWDADRQPVSGAGVSLETINGIPVRGIGGSTDGNGIAELPVPAGVLVLNVRKNHLEAKVSVSITRGANVPVDAVLLPKEEK